MSTNTNTYTDRYIDTDAVSLASWRHTWLVAACADVGIPSDVESAYAALSGDRATWIAYHGAVVRVRRAAFARRRALPDAPRYRDEYNLLTDAIYNCRRLEAFAAAVIGRHYTSARANA